MVLEWTGKNKNKRGDTCLGNRKNVDCSNKLKCIGGNCDNKPTGYWTRAGCVKQTGTNFHKRGCYHQDETNCYLANSNNGLIKADANVDVNWDKTRIIGYDCKYNLEANFTVDQIKDFKSQYDYSDNKQQGHNFNFDEAYKIMTQKYCSQIIKNGDNGQICSIPDALRNVGVRSDTYKSEYCSMLKLENSPCTNFPNINTEEIQNNICNNPNNYYLDECKNKKNNGDELFEKYCLYTPIDPSDPNSPPKNYKTNICLDWYLKKYEGKTLSGAVTTVLNKNCPNDVLNDDKISIKDNIDPIDLKLCGCFLGDPYYENYNNEINKKMGILPYLFKDPQCYNPYCIYASLKPEKNKKCPNNNLQVCISDSVAKLDSEQIENNQIAMQQSINCILNIGGTPTSPINPTSPISPTSPIQNKTNKNNLWIIILISVLVWLIISVGIYFLIKHKL